MTFRPHIKDLLIVLVLFIAPFWLSTLLNDHITMEQVNFSYSTKNIPVAPKSSYLKCLIDKTESFIRRLRWKCFFYKNPQATSAQKETYGFNSTKSPPPMDDLKEFESRLTDLIQNVEFRNDTHNQFQNNLKKDLKAVTEDKRVTVKADKTTNYYKLQCSKYNDLLHSNITTTYKKCNGTELSNIKQSEKQIADKLDLSDRIEQLAPKQSYITLKDHKENFRNNPKCRLINPAKSQIGKISKQILDRIIHKVLVATKLNLWKNTSDVIGWFRSLPDKQNSKFICFDIVNFYPSITEELLNKSLDFAEQFTELSNDERQIITQAKSSLLFSSEQPWRKKGSDSLFDVTMGSNDGAETCELVVCYLLSILQSKYGNSIGLYRDDGLSAFNKPPNEVEKIKKDICKIFRENNLHITVEANKTITDYLDVTFDLECDTYQPFMKPNNNPVYVNTNSNHPPKVLKNIPKGINTRLSNISSSEEVFDRAKPAYQSALNASGYDYQLHYSPQPRRARKSRGRNVIWFNPPFNSNVKTNVGKEFFKILDKCFPDEHPLHKIFNRNTIKLSYSTMPNVSQIIQSTNAQKLKKHELEHNKIPEIQPKTCNCRNKQECPLQGKCLTRGVIYQAKVDNTSDNTSESYIGLATEFKSRYRNHLTTFRNCEKRTSTELSKHIWMLKDSNKQFTISWTIMCHANPYNSTTRKCNLCLSEKYFIICKPHLATLNKKSELLNTCRHKSQFLLKSLKPKQ